MTHQQLERCPVSGDNRLTPLKGYEATHLVRSRSVGFVFCRQVPSAEELRIAYDHYQRDYALAPLTRVQYSAVLASLQKYRTAGRVLDLGCGSGHFLDVAKERGWSAYGTETSDEAVTICRAKGISMTSSSLVPNEYEPGFFDVVIMTELIEHVNNPREVLAGVHRLLRPGGAVYFTTPNFNSIERFVLKSRYGIITYPEHLSYYTPPVIDILFKAMGFKREQLWTQGISVFRIMQAWERQRDTTTVSQPSSSAEAAAESVRSLVKQNAIFRAALAVVNGTLNLLGIGTSLRGIYVKS